MYLLLNYIFLTGSKKSNNLRMSSFQYLILSSKPKSDTMQMDAVNPPDSSNHPGKGQCSAAASSGFWLPIPSLSESSGYCRDPCCANRLQSCHGPYTAQNDKDVTH